MSASNSQTNALNKAVRELGKPNPELPRVGVDAPTGPDIDWKTEWFKLAASRNRDVGVMLKELKELHEEWVQDLKDAAGLSATEGSGK